MWTVTLKGLLKHRLRLLLTTLSVVLGVAFVAGTFVLTDTMSAVFDDLVRGGSETVDVLVRGETATAGDALEDLDAAPPPIPAEIVDDVLAVDGVASAEGAVEGYAMIVRPDGEAIVPMGPPTLGAAWSPSSGRVIREGGRAPAGPDEVVVDATTADRHDLAPGDRVDIVFADVAPRAFTIVGISTAEAGDNLAGATLAEFEPGVAQEVLGFEDQFTAINVWAADGVDHSVLVERLETALPADLDAITAAEWADETMAAVDEALSFITAIFGVFAAIALIVGAFIIANTFSITVVQRTREFALLRSLGASRSQIVRSVVGEAAAVGLLASLLGVLAGLGLAVGLHALLGAFGMDMPSGTLVLQPRTVVVSLAVGLVVTVVASLLPARRAAGVHPMEALRAVSIQAFRPSRWRVAGGVVAGVVAAVLLGVAAVTQPENGVLPLGLGAVLALVALAATGPLLTRPVLRLLGGSGRRFGAVGRLARSNSLRTPRRTWTTAAALTVGLALVSSVAVIAASMKASVSDALDGVIRADAIVSAANAMTGGTVPPVVATEIDAVPEVGVVTSLRAATGQIDGASSAVTAIDPDRWDAVATTVFTEGSLADLAPVGTVAVDANNARERGYAIGDRIPVAFPATDDLELTVAAIFEQDELLSGWLVSTATHEQLVFRPTDATVLVAAADGTATSDVIAAVEQVTAGYPAVQVQDRAQYRDSLAGQVDQILSMVMALLGMALFIAVLGIMNTLALSIHERTHEIGLLRAVGMTRRQARTMIRWEAVTVAVLGAFVGLLLGLVFGWVTVRVLADEGLTSFVMPYPQLIQAVVLAVLAGVLAAVLPARRAARLDVLRAVTVE